MSRSELVAMLVAEGIPIHDDYLESIFPTPDSVIVRRGKTLLPRVKPFDASHIFSPAAPCACARNGRSTKRSSKSTPRFRKFMPAKNSFSNTKTRFKLAQRVVLDRPVVAVQTRDRP